MLMYTAELDNEGIIGIIERTCNHVDPRLIHHGFRVSYIVSKLLPEFGITDKRLQRDVCLLALLHDIGAYKTEEIDKMVQFETGNVLPHSAYGYLFIRNFSPLHQLAEAVLLHHTHWQEIKDSDKYSEEIKNIAQLIFIADRADIMTQDGKQSWKQFIAYISHLSGVFFRPEMVEAMGKLHIDGPIDIQQMQDPEYLEVVGKVPFTVSEITGYLKMMTYVIDFRSRHTVTHTITTTSISQELAEQMHLNDMSVRRVVCGALLHDLGKIGIPVEILEFPGKLSSQAMNVMREHVNLTEEILGGVIEEQISNIALRHHEKLNGTGYPRGLTGEELAVEERIVAVADIVSALAGTRSYKEAYDKEKIVTIIKNMSHDGLIDSFIVDIMVENFEQIMDATNERCDPVLKVYNEMQAEFDAILEINL